MAAINRTRGVYKKVTLVLESDTVTTTLDFFNVPANGDTPKGATPISLHQNNVTFLFEYLRTQGSDMYMTSKTEPKEVEGVTIE